MMKYGRGKGMKRSKQGRGEDRGGERNGKGGRGRE